jgi:hypothetical protein
MSPGKTFTIPDFRTFAVRSSEGLVPEALERLVGGADTGLVYEDPYSILVMLCYVMLVEI